MSPPSLKSLRLLCPPRPARALTSCIARLVSSLPLLAALPPTTSAQVWESQSKLVEKMLAAIVKAEKDAEAAKTAD